MSRSTPPFIFRVDEIQENPRSRPSTTRQGHWRPSVRRGDNVRVAGGASGLWWLCSTQGIQQLPSVEPDATPYQTFSMFYSGNFGFWIMRGDAISPHPAETWHPLMFDHDGHDSPSYLTNAGTKERICCQSPSQDWTSMLLPIQYQCQPSLLSRGQGGLRGDLAIFLGLLALSMEPHYLTRQLLLQFRGGAWQRHKLPRGWIDGRGVVVYVYTCPPSWAATYGASTSTTLHNYENYGKYFE